jgi:haloacetate dehalogenase
MTDMMDDFTPATIETAETGIFVRWSGSGPPVLLLHGFPQTHLMWRGVAPLLARNFTVICADQRLPGLRDRPCPIRQAIHGARHGDRDGTARIPALRGCWT